MGNRQQRQKVLAEIMRKPNGARIIAQSMTQPLRYFQDYESVGRNAFLVETLKQGEDPLLDVDVTGSMAYQVADLGQDILTLVNPSTIRPDTQELAANPEISYSQMAARKYDVRARVEQYAKVDIFRVEDRMVFNSLLAAATHTYRRPIYQKNPGLDGKDVFLGKFETVTITGKGDPVNKPITTTAGNVSIKEISAAMAQIERHGGLKPTNLFMNPINNQILRNINVNDTNGYFVDFDTSSEIMKNGYLGRVYGLQIFVSPEIPEDTLLITSEREFTGRIVERIPLTVIPYEAAKERRSGFSIFEEIGICCYNPKAVAAVIITDRE